MIRKNAKQPSRNLAELNAKLQKWQKQHGTPKKVATAHRKVLLERVVQSMAFENQPVSMTRLKALLRKNKASDK